jgi:acetate kinase
VVAPELVLVVNAGSSSLKLSVLDAAGKRVASREAEAADDPGGAIESFLQDAPPPGASGHRVVHGGAEFTEPVLVDDEVERRLDELAELAPLHNPAAFRALKAMRELRPDLPAVACFDTAFHRTLPPAASTYAIPAEWAERWGPRRFGFHGLSHAYASRRAAELLEVPIERLRLVTAHLGAGASLAAVAGGRSVDTTMGFTPLDGLVMATRSGSVDPGLLLWVQRHGGFDPGATERALDREAGLLGISGITGDMRELLGAERGGNDRAALAISVYLHRLRSSIAAMAASMGGIDGLVFTGGVGENSAPVRARACEGLRFLGVELDAARNAEPPETDARLSPPGAQTHVLVVHAREDLEIAQQVRAAA